YRTGDRVRRRPDGALEYAGRFDDQAKVHGVRIEPGEIEGALVATSGVRAAAVVGHEDPVAGLALVAYVVPRREAPRPTEAGLRASLATHLPATFVPSRFVVLDELPLTANG